jgi:uncharacterized protein
MVKGFLSHLSNKAKLAMLFGLLLGFLLFSYLLGILLLIPFMGPGIIQQLSAINYSDPSMVNAHKAMQIINMAVGLLLPSWLFVYFTEQNPSNYLGLRSLIPRNKLLLTAVFMIVIQPFISFTNDINSYMALPASFSGIEQWMKDMEDQAQQITDAFLGTLSLPGFLVNFFMIALLPAFCEEILFRGVLANLLRKWTGNIHWAVIISALVFAGIHLQFYGFLPRFLLGLMFGYLFFQTGSLWIPIVAHFTNNFLAVLIEYLFRKGIISVNAEQFGFSDNYLVVALSLVLGGYIFYLVYRKRKEESNLSF